MPNVEIKNETSFPLNIALSQVCPLHFGNSIAPASSLKIFCGSVWFTFEWGRDLETEKSRYSAGKSAKALALVSLATVGCMAVAGPLAVSAAAAAGSAGAAALLASPALVAAGSVEVLAVSGFVGEALLASLLLQCAHDDDDI